jgi:hypothetical protein
MERSRSVGACYVGIACDGPELGGVARPPRDQRRGAICSWIGYVVSLTTARGVARATYHLLIVCLHATVLAWVTRCTVGLRTIPRQCATARSNRIWSEADSDARSQAGRTAGSRDQGDIPYDLTKLVAIRALGLMRRWRCGWCSERSSHWWMRATTRRDSHRGRSG